MNVPRGAPREVLVVEATAFASTTAALLGDAIRSAVEARGRCRIVLAGGRTPAAVYRVLAADATMPWAQVVAFIGDERCVPPDHAESNYRMIAETLLHVVPIPGDQVFRLRGELGADAAAAEYDVMLDALAGAPKFDIVLSGVGADGHTASLFPGDPRVDNAAGWAMAAVAPAPFAISERVGLTLRALNDTRLQLVLCTSDDKKPVRRRILGGEADAMALPAALLSGVDRTVWIIDPD
ncbi:MAG: 6-phosphogluconolactonase [Gemmatimonadota bacterium]